MIIAVLEISNYSFPIQDNYSMKKNTTYNINKTKRKCKVCGSNSPYFASAKILQKYDVKYYQCHSCGFVQTEEPYWLNEAYTDAIDINKYFPDIPLSSITVAQCGVNPLFHPASSQEITNFRYKYGIQKPYFLLGALGGYKNSILFMQAFAQLANKTGFDIVATGAGALLPAEWRQFTAGCTFYGLQLTDEELRIAYSGAVALVYPSKYEGFGMPVIEAMACGCPVITTPNASLPEVGGDAVIYVNDDDIDGMANALCDVQKPGLRRNLIEAGLQQAQKFSWTTMAEIVKEALFNAISPQIKLTNTNYLIFPDWQSDEETLTEELYNLISSLAKNSPLIKLCIINIFLNKKLDKKTELCLNPDCFAIL
jgi:glycosyltransferase involved in cell wall biosynthesis